MQTKFKVGESAYYYDLDGVWVLEIDQIQITPTAITYRSKRPFAVTLPEEVLCSSRLDALRKYRELLITEHVVKLVEVDKAIAYTGGGDPSKLM